MTPPRLHVLLARETPIGVILRRGPTNWVQMIKWHTNTDTFESGQWLHGRLYNDRCDLSPDGQLLVYFAGKFSQKTMRDDKFAWTAISKPPYFTALDIQFQSDTWGGGGIFTTANQVWFSASTKRPTWEPKHVLSTTENGQSQKPPQANFPYTYPERMRFYLGGWQEIGQTNNSRWPRLIWQKTVHDNSLTYTEINYTRNAPDTTRYTLKQNNTGSEMTLSSVSWADFDQQGRLVLAQNGKLLSAILNGNKLNLTELADFNDNQPEQIETPEWAQKW